MSDWRMLPGTRPDNRLQHVGSPAACPSVSLTGFNPSTSARATPLDARIAQVAIVAGNAQPRYGAVWQQATPFATAFACVKSPRWKTNAVLQLPLSAMPH